MPTLTDLLGGLTLLQPVVPPETAQARNLIIWPPRTAGSAPPLVEGTLTHPAGDLTTDATPPPRLCAFLGPGSTLAGLAVDLAAVISRTTTRTTNAPISDPNQVSRALLTYTAPHLSQNPAGHLHAGTRLPLPIEIDQANNRWVTNLQSLHNWARHATTSAHTVHTVAVVPPAEDPDQLRLTVAAQVSASSDVTLLSGPLVQHLLRNPYQAFSEAIELFRQMREQRPDHEPALAMATLQGLARHHADQLASTTAGNRVMGRLWAALNTPAANNLPPAQQPALLASRRLAAGALGLIPVPAMPDTWLPPTQAVPTVVPQQFPARQATTRRDLPPLQITPAPTQDSSSDGVQALGTVPFLADPGPFGPNDQPATFPLTVGGLPSTPPTTSRRHGVVTGPMPFANTLAAIFTAGQWIHVANEPRYAVADNLRRATMWGHLLWGGRSYLVLEGFPDVPAPFLVLPTLENVTFDKLDWTQRLDGHGSPTQHAATYFWRDTWGDATGRHYKLRLIAPVDGSQAPPPLGATTPLDPPRFLFPAKDKELINAEWAAFTGDEAAVAAADVRAAIFNPLWTLTGEGDISKPGVVDLERAAGRLAELDATAFSILTPAERAHYANVLAHAFTTKARERAIVELFKTAEDRPALNQMIAQLTPTDYAKVLRDLDYELWSLFVAVGERFPPTSIDFTLDDLIDLVFALWPQLHTVITRENPSAPPALDLDQLDELYVAASAALKFVVDSFEGIFQVITEPDKLVEGVWQLIKLALMAQLAQPPISDPQALQYLGALFTLLGQKIQAAYRGAIALGAVEHTLTQLKWAIIWEVASWFVGVGEVRAGLQAFKEIRGVVEAWAAMARPAKLAVDAVEAAEKFTVTAKLERVMKLLNAKINFGTDVELIRALGYAPDSDTAKIAKGLENVDLDPIARFDDLPLALKDDLLRLNQRLDAAKPLETVVGPLSENGRNAFKKLADHHMLLGDAKNQRFSRLMNKLAKRNGVDITAEQWEAFAAAVNAMPPAALTNGPGARDLNFLLRLSRQPDACLLIARPNGYAAFSVLWDHVGNRFDSLNAMLRRMEKLAAEALPEQRMNRYAEMLDKLAQKDQKTIEKIENYGKPVRTPIGAATKTLDELKDEALNTPPGPAFKAFRERLDAYPDFKGSVGEAWLRKWVFAKDPHAGKRVYVYKHDNPALAEEMIALERSADAFTSPATGTISWWDGKVYGSKTDIDWEQALDNELFEGANEVMVRFQKHDPTGPPPVELPQKVKFDEIGYIFFDAKAAKRNRAAVQTDASGEVYYLDELGNLQHMN
ncbi:hypothetical protein AB0H57_18645 [Micromonospora sp. NPDC050686]|uniref:hypothetical protein n=1 Tax=Micromonospora sp. NPDC050686 TaxID=3154631 RepID=UPI0033E76374